MKNLTKDKSGFTLYPRASSLRSSNGFTLIELLVVVAIIGILASVVLSSLSDARGRAHDARRLSDMKAIHTALVLYELDNGSVPQPAAVGYPDHDGSNWDVSHDGNFMQFLVDGGYLSSNILDPINDGGNNDNSLAGNERYYRYTCANNGVNLSYRESDGNLIYYARDIIKTGDPAIAGGTYDPNIECSNIF